jgi:hypothetical protein
MTRGCTYRTIQFMGPISQDQGFAAYHSFTSVRCVLIAVARAPLFSVSFGENRRSQ